jgi:hypothetical protein
MDTFKSLGSGAKKGFNKLIGQEEEPDPEEGGILSSVRKLFSILRSSPLHSPPELTCALLPRFRSRRSKRNAAITSSCLVSLACERFLATDQALVHLLPFLSFPFHSFVQINSACMALASASH